MTVLFWVFALMAIGGALAVVLVQNVVRMAFWLVISLGSVSALFFLIGADFLGAAQLLVYVGGTVVLLIFGVMLTASGPFSQIKSSPGELVLSGGVGLLFLTMLVSTVFAVEWPTEVVAEKGFNDPQVGNTTRPIGLALLGLRPDVDLGAPEGTQSTGYLLPFEIASVHLLVVLIGASYLARAKQRVTPDEARSLADSLPGPGTVSTERAKYADLWSRFLALVADGVVLTAAFLLLAGVFRIVVDEGGEMVVAEGRGGWALALCIVLEWLYFAGLESSPLQATLGKWLLGVAVTDVDGRRITFGRATLRYVGKVVSAVILLIGFLVALFTQRRQALHDLLAKTVVVPARRAQGGTSWEG